MPPQTKQQPKYKKSYKGVLGYWCLFSLIIFFLVFGGYLDLTTWMINFKPSPPYYPIGRIPIPFVWFIIPFMVMGILFTIAAWAGYQLIWIPRLRAPLSHYNPFRRRKKEVQNDSEQK